MLSIQLNEARFKACARLLSQALKSRGITIAHQSALQVLSEALTAKPYEEILSTQLTLQTKVSVGPENHVVMILHYGSQSILVVDWNYISATNEGTDMEIPFRVLEAEAERHAKILGVSVQNITLPKVLDHDYADDDVIELASKMGYGKQFRSIFTCLSEMSGVTINGKHFDDTGLDMGVVDTLCDEDDPWSACVWMPELRTIEGVYEYFFTLDDLCRSVSLDGQTWKIPYQPDAGVFCEVTFLYVLKSGSDHR